MKISVEVSDPLFSRGQKIRIIHDWTDNGQVGTITDIYFNEARFDFDQDESLFLRQGHWMAIVQMESGKVRHLAPVQIEVIE